MNLKSETTRREFIRTTARAAGVIAVAPFAVLKSQAAGVPEGRLERLASGANICRWFRFPRSESVEHFRDYISDEEAAFMKQIGLRHVRLCVAPDIIAERGMLALREDRVRLVEAAILRLQRAGLMVMVDIHNEDRASEADPEWQDRFVEFWKYLAGRLSDTDPEMTMLEIVNEPVFRGREDEWNPFNVRLAETIRHEAPDHTIVTSGANWGGIDGLRKLDVLPDRNVVYSFHCYEPFPFTHQGATWSSEEVKPLRNVPYPSSPEAIEGLLPGLSDHPAARGMIEHYGRERWGRERLAARFDQAIEWGMKHGVPLYCGEFGVYPRNARHEHRANWFRDFGDVLSENSIGWAVWGWDEGFGLNRRNRGGRISVDEVVANALGLKVG